MDKKLLLFLAIVLALYFNSVQTVLAQACGATIDEITPPENAPEDENGNFTACSNGSQDALYAQDDKPMASLQNVDYVIEFSNGNPLIINNTGTWNSAEQGLVEGDTVSVTAFTYDISAIDQVLDLAEFLCNTPEDTLFGVPCKPVIDLIEGNNDGERGLQTLSEALLLASSFLSVQIYSVDTAVNVLNDVNVQLGELAGITICFNYTLPYKVIVKACTSDCANVAGTADVPLETFCLNNNPEDLIVTSFSNRPVGIYNGFIVTDGESAPSSWDQAILGFSADGSFEPSKDKKHKLCFLNISYEDSILLSNFKNCAEGFEMPPSLNTLLASCNDADGCYNIGALGTEYCIEVCNANDVDDDGVSNEQEDVDGNGDFTDDDTDGDGIPNYEDADDDGDGVTTANEDNNGNGDLKDDDADEDGIPDYLDDEFTTSVSIYENYGNISVYPNPNNGIFTIDLPGSEILETLEIYNLAGQNFDYVRAGKTIQLTGKCSGLYFVKISTKNGTYVSKVSVQ